MIILVDQDGVIFDFNKGIENKLREKNPEIKLVSYERLTNFYLADNYPEEYREGIERISKSQGFFEGLPIIPGAKEALEEMISKGHDVRICTNPLSSYRHCVEEKYTSVERHLGYDWTKRIILTKDKTFVRGDILIDDKPKVEGLFLPTWEHVLYDHPCNRKSHGRRLTWDNWKEVLSEF